MYPYIEFQDMVIYMTGLGIVIFILSIIFLVKFYSKRFNLNFWKFFNWLPLFLILPYILGSYFYNLFYNYIVFPLSINDLMLIISPYDYNFSFVWITLGLLLAVVFFLRSISIPIEKVKWVDVFFYSISLSLVPLGLFLVLGDDFIGLPTDRAFWVSAFMQDSFITRFSWVYPVGLFVSLIWIFSFIMVFFLNFVFRRYGIWVLWFIILLLLFNIVFHFQYYEKVLDFSLFEYEIGLKNYWTILLSLFLVYYYYGSLYNPNKHSLWE